MVITMTNDEKDLEKVLDSFEHLDAIVVEGYDGVGKGVLLSKLSEKFGVEPYRPDYNLWQKYDHRKEDRWKVSGFFWDIYSHFYPVSTRTLLFDRGIFSGAVYNNDMSIAKDYKNIVRDLNILNILVVCSKEDYFKMCFSRDPSLTHLDVLHAWEKYDKFTERYKKAFEYADLDYIIYINEFDEEFRKVSADTCESCGHYNHGWCRHPNINCRVNKETPRCEYSTDKEVQDTI